jgi:predicted dehydrogenase
MRVGLVGTGYWARITHAPALAAHEGIEFSAVWGRNQRAAAELAASHGARAFTDFDEFLAGVDAVDFSVPPDIQAELAVRAVRAGKHLLLEKPIATSLASADVLVGAVEQAGVSSVVFFTARFQPDVRAWLADLARGAPPVGGHAEWFGTSLRESSPFNTPWRQDKGSLWDLGPHAVSLLWASLGPVVAVTADAGPADMTYLVLHHDGGSSSTVTMTQLATAATQRYEVSVWGDGGRSAAPAWTSEPPAVLRVALGELAANAADGRADHECDVRFGREVVRILAEAEQQIEERRARRG